MELFYTATIITVENGRKTPFWHAPWLEAKRPIDICAVDLCLLQAEKLEGGASFK